MSVLLALLLTACGTAPPPAPAPPPPPPPPAPSAPSTSPSTPAPKPAPVVVLDPGHNGGNSANPAVINRKVPAGRGRTKPCNTTGTATDAGFPEHAFTWAVANRTARILAEKGVKVLMTRQDDDGVGPCVDERAAAGNRAGAAAVVSIHADGSTKPGAHGFHVAYSAPPLNAAQGEPSTRLATALRDDLRGHGFAVSDYLGQDGLAPRDDLAGLNLSERPAALVECGNMRNATEAARMASEQGQRAYAEAISAGILRYLG
ncbi:N-acetylmuramoyl-L-alanine amidase [Amycolatopsis suaedae]|uniref:N-acetylmuramoyl-L-alanine amidase n=1 Tax=Amycolatopsis suaedae TaxID=2510978 RepID=A0A4Q7JED9_9PSEU|nr:N-acetylmuramoyl-L-alanine amidase [Amycolatopsis suaedae]